MLDRVRVMRNRIAQRLAAATALLSLVAVSAATSGVWLRCRITGALQPACCCPAADDANHAAPKPATAEAGDCCDRIVTDVEQAPSEIAPRDRAVAPALVVPPADVRDALSTVARALRRESERPRAGPPDTRARLLSKSSFLI